MQQSNNIPELLIQLFQNDLPGHDAHKIMLAKPLKPLPINSFSNKKTPSAVLILLYPKDKDLRFILTKRTQLVKHHKGQISLPGGVMQSNESLQETALRETWEEIGIPPENMHVFGNLSPLHVKVSGFEIQPFVAWMNKEPSIVPAPQEVEDVLSISLTDLLNDDILELEEWEINGHPVSVPFFRFDEAKVWGATAMILAEFKHIFKQNS